MSQVAGPVVGEQPPEILEFQNVRPPVFPDKKEIIKIIGQNNKTASAVSWHLISRTLETSRDFTDQAKTIQTPVLYLYGGNSYYHGMALTNAEFLKAHLRNAKIVRFNDGIHDLELQKPEDVAALVLEFLAENGTNEKSASNSNNQISSPK